jgi:hypothetical protein
VSYAEELSRELGAVGIRGRLRDRITAEVRDHLECDPSAELGRPAAVAAQFADELGTVRSRRAAFGAFGALAFAGVLFAVAGVTAVSGFPHGHPHSALAAAIGVGMAALGAQIAFVAGVSAVIRGLRRRTAVSVSRAEAVILVRRTGTALLAGAIGVAGLALVAVEYDRGVASSRTTVALVLIAAAAVGLLGVIPAVMSAARVRPTGAGAAGDIFDDLGRLVPNSLRGHVWLFALTVTGLVVVLVTVAGVGANDPFDGAARGVADGIACLGCFAVLGRYLGLRPSRLS